VRCGHRDQLHVAGGWLEPAHHIAALHSEPKGSVLIKDGRVRVMRSKVGHGIFADIACLGIKLPDVALEISCEPDFTVFVSNEPVWS
jgi:hypothetical protein